MSHNCFHVAGENDIAAGYPPTVKPEGQRQAAALFRRSSASLLCSSVFQLALISLAHRSRILA